MENNPYLCTRIRNVSPIRWNFLMNEKGEQIISRIKAMKEENDALRNEVENLKKELLDAKVEVKQMEAKYERVKLARVYGWDQQSKNQAIARITALVREIDYCLELLKKS